MNSLDNAKAGDKLLVCFNNGAKGIATVERATQLYVITKTHRFVKRKGEVSGCDPWTCTYAQIATPEDIERINREVKRKKLVRKCQDINFNTLSDTQLEQILEIANNHVKLD